MSASPPPSAPFSEAAATAQQQHEQQQQQQQEYSLRRLWIHHHVGGEETVLPFTFRCTETFRGEMLNTEEEEGEEGRARNRVDRTGLLLWPGTFLTCAYLLSVRETLLPLNKKSGEEKEEHSLIVELGAGATGLAGLLALQLCDGSGEDNPSLSNRLVLTDGDMESVGLLEWNKNTTGAGRSGERINVQRLRWGCDADVDAIISGNASNPDNTFTSLVLGSDLLYPAIDFSTIRKLLQSARALLLGGREAPPAQPVAGRLILSFIDRDNKSTLRKLLLALREERFVLEEVVDGDGLFFSDKGGLFRVEEEDEEEEEEKEGPGLLQSRPTRRHRLQMMGGGKVLILRPFLIKEEKEEEEEEQQEKWWADHEKKWFANVWDEQPIQEDEAWEGPPLSSDDEEEEEEEEADDKNAFKNQK